MTAAFAETPIFDALFAEVDATKRQLVLVAIADKPHAVEQAAIDRVVESSLAVVAHELDGMCGDCGRDDCALTETAAGAFWCGDCEDANAYDAGESDD